MIKINFFPSTIFIALFLFLASAFYFPVRAEEIITHDIFTKAQVLEIVDEGTRTVQGFDQDYQSPFQKVSLKILDGVDINQTITIDYTGMSASSFQKVTVGQIVILNKTEVADGSFQYQIIDRFRLNELVMIALLFLALVIILSRWKGIGSILGMLFSLLVILKFIIPQILAGKDPLTISILGSVAILITSIYLAHGFSKQTSVAVFSTALTLIITGFLSVYFVKLTNLSGLSNEDTTALLFGGPTATINFKGLLLGGMIIGFLGVLDDITTGMSATVFELKKVNSKLTFADLIKSSLNVGVEHISSLVNTLVLAYAGASLPLFLYIVLNPQGYPIWFMVNSEFIAEEIVRTLVGSIGLLFAVPITTAIAAWAVSKKS